jgi:Protein of unknown function (DUF1592)/Protein of unknown function (DUF1588)/Protein of unknown function (DUF1587)/Protein of unknown function (DUF1595)/Protein of unknown function (DUF1585)/Planctomycete cytochrome C
MIRLFLACVCLLLLETCTSHAQPPTAFFVKHCVECHDATAKQGGLDLTSLKMELSNAENFARWVKVHDRIESGEMPPKQQARPAADERIAATRPLKTSLVQAERDKLKGQPRTSVRRLTKAEYENTIRDLFEMSGIPLQGELPADGSAHGFDKNSDALDISHVNMAKYIEAADRTLDMAIATRPQPPTVTKQRISLANPAGFVAHVLMNGDGVLLKNKQPDPDFPPAGEQNHIDQGAHERMGSFRNGASVGLFRHEDESFHPYFIEFVTLYPGRYRMRTSLWSFLWDKGKVLPGRGTEAARLSVVQLTGDGRGGGHPSYVLGYYDAPSMTEREHEVEHWLNFKETIGFNTASLAPTANYSRKGRAMAFTGPGIVCDWFDIEGPLHDVWPPVSHRQLFGDLPIVEFIPAEHPNERPPKRTPVRREVGAGKNEPDKDSGIWTVHSDQPLVDADRLLARFLPKAFRRPVPAEARQQYVANVESRLKAADCFETAMRATYRAALCSPDFLYHVEPVADVAETGTSTDTKLPMTSDVDDLALASRLSYFFWNSMPDDRLTELAAAGKLHEPDRLRAEVERMLEDARSQRFVEDFLGQWMKLRQIASTDPDRKLYPEFSAYLQDSMVAETHAYFRELIDKNLDASHLVRSNFAMLNEKLAVHYGIPGVSGSQIRRVELPADCPRGGFLTQASILKITANGTTTSPVPRGAFVMDRLLGQPPDPPPASVPAIEPDVRGAKTIREQLDKHRTDTVCASCHAKMDPPGFALESFDVIGGFRTRYRSIGEGDPAPRGSIDPFIGIGFKLGPPVDPSGVLPDERSFADIVAFQKMIASDSTRLLKNLAQQLAIYSTGRDILFCDRDEIESIVSETQRTGGGIRSLIHALVQSRLFRTR